MGRYVPPALEGLLTHNQASNSKPSASPTVRFEMPFAVWCTTCPKPTIIGQGVRFNAAKRKVGSYYSSTIWAFSFTHTACGGAIEVRTDPKNTAYVVHAGARKRDTGEEKTTEDSLVPTGDALLALSTTRAEAEEARATAFSTLEKTINDRAALAAASARIDELEDVAEKQWDDPYARNQALRKAFRVGRKQRQVQAGLDGELKERLGLGIELLEANEEDARRARLVDYGTRPEGDDDVVSRGEDKVLARPLFKSSVSPVVGALDRTGRKDGKAPRKLKSEIKATKLKESLVSEIVVNTRMVRDPFLERKTKDSAKPAAIITGLKRKRGPDREFSPQAEEKPPGKVAAVLVDYESD